MSKNTIVFEGGIDNIRTTWLCCYIYYAYITKTT